MPSAWGLPPEVNHVMLRSGAGAAAHTPQIAAYTALATHYTTQAAQQTMMAAATATQWVGAGGTAMLAQALPMAAWQTAVAMHASTTAANLSSGVAAYETALASMIPAERCIANRVETATLHATNFMGFNTPAIIEHDIEYGEYWAQNAGARTGLAASLTGLAGGLAAPLPAYPGMSSPAVAAGAAGVGIGVAGFGVAASALGAGVSAASGVGGGAASALGAGVATGLGAGVSTGLGAGLSTGLGSASGIAADTPLTGSANPTPAPTSASAPVSAPVSPAAAMPFMPAVTSSAPVSPAAPTQAAPLTAAEGESAMTGTLSEMTSTFASAPAELASAVASAPQGLISAATAPLQSVGSLAGLPTSMLAAAPLASVASGMSRNPQFATTATGSAASSARGPLTGMSTVNGGYSGGGSPVSASISEHGRVPTDWATPPTESINTPAASGGSPAGQPASSGVGMIPPPITGNGRDDRDPPAFDPTYKTVTAPKWEGALLN